MKPFFDTFYEGDAFGFGILVEVTRHNWPIVHPGGDLSISIKLGPYVISMGVEW